jgi:Ca2+-binding EF-hand superfamily protein
MSLKVWVCAAALSIAVAPATFAQGRGQARGQQGRENMRFAGMDRNGDGVITRAEWNGNARAFQNNDWNGDGILSGEEVRPAGQRTVDPGASSAALEQDFITLDFNRDGIVTEDEWYFQRADFVRIDRNRDNIITRAEFLNQNVAGTTGRAPAVARNSAAAFADLDANDDGRVSVNEWQGTPERFEVLDSNRNGFLSRREMTANEGTADVFNTIDSNRNGAITREEWRSSRDEFDRLDANRDGRISRAELTGTTPLVPETAAFRTGYDRGLAEGRDAGRQDFQNNRRWDLEGQRELEQADSGYQTSLGPRADYQSGYREGFRRGYREGFGQ